MQGLHNGGYLWEVDITIQHASNIEAIFLAFQLELTRRKGSIFLGNCHHLSGWKKQKRPVRKRKGARLNVKNEANIHRIYGRLPSTRQIRVAQLVLNN